MQFRNIYLRLILFICIHILIYLLKRIVKKKEAFTNSSQMLNIYNEPLIPCQEQGMTSGSWDGEGKCSETGGGVHQICIKNIATNATNFSANTGQSNWSDQRGSDNHCVCLGAWSLYNAKKSQDWDQKKILKCEAIPKIALSKDYVGKFSEGWNKWNGLELTDQIKNGVTALVDNCYDAKNAKSQKLKENYCQFAKEVPTLKETKKYQELCHVS